MKVQVEETDDVVVAYSPPTPGQGILKVIESSEGGVYFLLWDFPFLPEYNRPETVTLIWRDEDLGKIMARFAEEVTEFHLDSHKN